MVFHRCSERGSRRAAAKIGAAEEPEPDAHGLDRFVRAQEHEFGRALSEIRAGRKRSHWMWFIFPQMAGLGLSAMSRRYAIGGLEEAAAYLRHPVLGPRLAAAAQAVLDLEGRRVSDVFGSPDDLKLRSCATLFASVAPAGSVFHRLLDRCFGGERDARTLDLLARMRHP